MRQRRKYACNEIAPIAALISALAATPAIAVPSVLVIDLPHGGCRLIVREDGSGAMAFGAAPKRALVAAGTFKRDTLVEFLQVNAYLPNDSTVTLPSEGSVSLPASPELRFVKESAYIKGLLERAWQARIKPVGPVEQSDHRWLGRACGFR